MGAIYSRALRAGVFSTCLSLAVFGAVSAGLQAAPFNIAPDGSPMLGLAVDTFGTTDTESYHFGPITEINDEVYLTGSVGLAPNWFINNPDPDGISGPQSNGIDNCCAGDGGPLDYTGVLFSSPVSGVNAVRVQNIIFADGGWWGPDNTVAAGVPLDAGMIAPPQVQVTTNGGATWTDVASTSDYATQLTGVPRGAGGFATLTPFATFSFASQNNINGIRLIGDGAGTPGAPDPGFLGLTEFIVLQEQGVVFPTLDVNTSTGEMTLQTSAGTARGIRGYTVSSAADVGAIDPSGWMSVAENYDQGNAGPNQIDANDPWTELSSSSSRVLLSESELSGGDGGSLNASLNIPLGDTWIPNPFGNDLRAEILLTDGRVRRIAVTYDGQASNPLIVGDFNFDGMVSPLDWATVRDNFNSDFTALTRAEGYNMGDVTGDGLTNHLDFAAFKTIYDDANGSGAFNAMLAGQVPEPSSVALMVFGAGLFGLGLRKGWVIG